MAPLSYRAFSTSNKIQCFVQTYVFRELSQNGTARVLQFIEFLVDVAENSKTKTDIIHFTFVLLLDSQLCLSSQCHGIFFNKQDALMLM